jgi:hypothetical protein
MLWMFMPYSIKTQRKGLLSGRGSRERKYIRVKHPVSTGTNAAWSCRKDSVKESNFCKQELSACSARVTTLPLLEQWLQDSVKAYLYYDQLPTSLRLPLAPTPIPLGNSLQAYLTIAQA